MIEDMIEEKIGGVFDDIGMKIQRLSIIFFVLYVLASIIGAIAIFIYMLDEEDFLIGLVCGVPILFLGPMLSWLLTAPLYGFGKLIENTGILVQDNKVNRNNVKSIQKILETTSNHQADTAK